MVFAKVTTLVVALFAGVVLCSPQLGTSKELEADMSAVGRSEQYRRMLRGISASDQWQKIISDYTRKAIESENPEDSAWSPHSISVDLPIGGKNGGTMPLLVVPVPVHSKGQGCDAHNVNYDQQDSQNLFYNLSPSRNIENSQNFYSTNRNQFSQNFNQYTGYQYSEGRSRAPPVRSLPPPVIFQKSGQQIPANYLLQKFLEQSPVAPHLPPAVIPEYLSVASEQEEVNIYSNAYSQQNSREYLPPYTPRGFEPSRPNFDRSLMIKAELTVPRADYTEPYTVWFDAATGASRVDYHNGATSSYRIPVADGSGRVKRLFGIGSKIKRTIMSLNRVDGKEMRVCGVAPPSPSQASDGEHPVLPDMGLFSFGGFEQVEGGRMERWSHVVKGKVGEMGAAAGEALTYTHNMMVKRNANDETIPDKYSVSVDSSVLGPNTDSYEHRYIEARSQEHPPEKLRPDMSKCDKVEKMDATIPEKKSLLEPLREFLMPNRDEAPTNIFDSFKDIFSRKYIDKTEEAIRKNLFVQNNRFVSSGNREGSTFQMAANFLSDRLDSELENLLGVVFDGEGFDAEQFPHSLGSLKSLANELPDEFDWRKKGGVTHVRYQGSCSSCWAFAVTGAVEGALFRETSNLVPLSEKCLVDCGHKHGANGCKGTWPSHAYDYVQDLGLPALNEYPAYKEMVDQCVDETVKPVTHISAHVNVTKNSIPALKIAIRKHAPSVVIIDAKAKSLIYYQKGVLVDERCGKQRPNLNHAVLAVGWGGPKDNPHFILKNSWSAAWGEQGYVRVAAVPNTCGVTSVPSYPRLEKKDVDNLPPGATSKPVEDDDDVPSAKSS